MKIRFLLSISVCLLFSCDSDEQSEKMNKRKVEDRPKRTDVFIDLNSHNFDDMRDQLAIGMNVEMFIQKFGVPDRKGEGYVEYLNWRTDLVVNAPRKGLFGLRIKYSQESQITQWIWRSK